MGRTWSEVRDGPIGDISASHAREMTRPPTEAAYSLSSALSRRNLGLLLLLLCHPVARLGRRRPHVSDLLVLLLLIGGLLQGLRLLKRFSRHGLQQRSHRIVWQRFF